MGQDSSAALTPDAPAKTLQDRTLESFALHLKNSKRIIVLTGAGISTSAGIPDFRSPETGLYSNLARLDLPYPEAVFDISFFRENPLPFYMLAQELYPGKYYPTISHAFIALLAKKGVLKMLFTQNIDCLERRAGVSDELVVEAHGSFAHQHCIDCSAEFPQEEMDEFVTMGDVPHCHECNGLVKPDIVFFGEQLPKRFFDTTPVASEGDAMIVIGTSLTVAPFSHLPEYAMDGTPRLLLNMEQVGGLGSRPDDVLLLGDCDSGICKLAAELDWLEELQVLYKEVGGPKAQTPASPVEDKRSKDEVLEDEIQKLTGEVDHALKISNGHKSWLEKHLSKKSAVTGGPYYEADDVEGTQRMPAADTISQETKSYVADLEAADTPNSSEASPADPLTKPPRHNETLATKQVDDYATQDLPSAVAKARIGDQEEITTGLSATNITPLSQVDGAGSTDGKGILEPRPTPFGTSPSETPRESVAEEVCLPRDYSQPKRQEGQGEEKKEGGVGKISGEKAEVGQVKQELHVDPVNADKDNVESFKPSERL